MFNKDNIIGENTSPHSPLQIIANYIRPHKTILDIGCNAGNFGKLVHSRNIIDGVDINKSALRKAKKYYRRLFCLDLTRENLPVRQKYDYIVLADILEHLPRPDLFLKTISKLLKPDGQVIASIPNIGRFEIRLKLLLGNFDYVDSGILNQDHLRFFTLKTGRQLFTDNGYKLIETIPTGLGHQFGIFPTLTAFQFIYIATNEK